MTTLAFVFEGVQLAASVATAIGVAIAGRQLQLAKRQSLTSFEDQLSSQYRAIVQRLPIEALLGETLNDETRSKALTSFYHYFDLSNEQAFLYNNGRITPETWNQWREGIEQNIARPAFLNAWTEVSRRAPDSFDELRSLLRSSSENPAAT